MGRPFEGFETVESAIEIPAMVGRLPIGIEIVFEELQLGKIGFINIVYI